MDRHNMMLFLQNDTCKLQPAGFEVPRRNIFDPEEDPVDFFENSDATEPGATSLVKELNEASHASLSSGMKSLATATSTGTSEACARVGCDKQPRFDSIFCSDSCGVSTLEKDLLHSLQYASKLHPSVLRL